MVEITAWEVARSTPGSVVGPSSDAFGALEWHDGTGPGTAASMLREGGRWSPESSLDFDDDDWWFRADVSGVAPGEGVIELDGLATIAEVWLNGIPLLVSDNMFLAHRCVVDLEAENELVIVCRSMKQHLAVRRRRPQWKTRLVSNQQLRWVRTTLLGRMPGWSPGPAPVGPWRPVRVHSAVPLRVSDWHVVSRMVDGDGLVDICCTIDAPLAIDRVAVTVGQVVASLAHDEVSGNWSGQAIVPNPRPWFPHTHGDPALHQVSLDVLSGGEAAKLDQRPIGFRELDQSRWSDEVCLVVNGVEVFARGACWIPPDTVRMWSDEQTLREALGQVVDAGMNLLRIPGTTVYEQSRFHELCDELGIMVWQDFMFANMQYPIDDDEFVASVTLEATKHARRLAGHSSTMVVCGGSEVEQQAAMMGASPEVIDGHRLGTEVLRTIVEQHAPGVAYVTNSPSGGHLPFSVSSGVAHYFGVGAYLRPLTDARFSRVRFASECLAIANVPNGAAVDRMRDVGGTPTHTTVWKAGVPRDGGAGWDFDDVRDHYLESIFGVDALSIRYGDIDRYLEYSRAVSYLLIEQTMTEWRRPDNPCAGAIVLQLRDVQEGAGWGLIDVTGAPKSAYFAVKRTCRPVSVLLSDDGLDGLTATVHNEASSSLAGSLEIQIFNLNGTTEVTRRDIHVPGRQSSMLRIDGMVEVFSDLTNAYRFGPVRADVVHVSVIDEGGRLMDEAFHLPGGVRRPLLQEPVLSADVRFVDDAFELDVSCSAFAQFVSIEVEGHRPSGNWFHLQPGGRRAIRCHRVNGSPDVARGHVRALNVAEAAYFHEVRGGS